MFVDLLRKLQPVRKLPVWLRWLLSAAIVLVFFEVRYLLDAYLALYPYLLFFPAILITSFVFDRGSGFVAVALSAVLAVYYFITPRQEFDLSNLGELLAFVLYVGVGLLLATMIEALRKTVDDLSQAYEALDEERAEVRRSHALLENVMNGVADAIFVKDREGRFVHVNEPLCRLFGMRRAAIIGRRDRDFRLAEEADFVETTDRNVIETGRIKVIENSFDVVTPSGKQKRRFLFTIGPWVNDNDELSGVIGTARDITDQRVAEDELRASNEQKNLLLVDINHRVKNHLQSVAGALSVSRQRVQSLVEAQAAMEATISRLSLLSRVYDRLHLRDGAVALDARAFLGGLCDDLRASLIGMRPVSLTWSIEEIELSANDAVNVGLIVNELLQNAIKYAFPDDMSGDVSVSFARAGSELVLEVSDNGSGMRGGKENGTGQRLVRALAKQLGGEAIWQGPPGTTALVRFPDD